MQDAGCTGTPSPNAFISFYFSCEARKTEASTFRVRVTVWVRVTVTVVKLIVIGR